MDSWQSWMVWSQQFNAFVLWKKINLFVGYRNHFSQSDECEGIWYLFPEKKCKILYHFDIFCNQLAIFRPDFIQKCEFLFFFPSKNAKFCDFINFSSKTNFLRTCVKCIEYRWRVVVLLQVTLVLLVLRRAWEAVTNKHTWRSGNNYRSTLSHWSEWSTKSTKMKVPFFVTITLTSHHLQFLPCDAMHGLSYRNSVCLSVRPSTWFDLRSWFLHHMVAPSF